MSATASILIVEDDPHIARIMMDHLRKEKYHVTWSSTGKEGLEDFRSSSFDLVIVDLMLPEMDGFSLCEFIRLESDVPLLIASARNENESKIKGLDLGADDYLTKPFSLEELSARISSHLRRYKRYMQKEDSSPLLRYEHGLTIDTAKELVYLHDEPVPLTAKETALLLLLAKNPFTTFSKSDLYEHIWLQHDLDGNNTITVHIKSVRSKLKDPTKNAYFIQTVWGIGYRFVGELRA